MALIKSCLASGNGNVTLTNLAYNHVNNAASVSATYTATEAINKQILATIFANSGYIGHTMKVELNNVDITTDGVDFYPVHTEMDSVYECKSFNLNLSANDVLKVTYTQASSTSSYLGASLDIIN